MDAMMPVLFSSGSIVYLRHSLVIMFLTKSRRVSLEILFLVTTVLVIETHSARSNGKLKFNHYRIVNDPQQVRAPAITVTNLFSWLNLRNSVRFKLWTRKNPELAHEIRYNDIESLTTSNFDPRRLTKILIHGFADTATEVAITYWLVLLRDAYLTLADLNVIIVDYSLFTIPLFYYTALPEIAGARVAEFIQFLVRNTRVQSESLHLIGFSWGAHVAGIAGHALKGKLGRITGLDPAGPTFHFLENQYRLDKSDAGFVDIIHTNAGKRLFTRGNLGISEALGHVDIYPNGGERQAGCPIKINPFDYDSLECSHGRSVRYFLESISSPLAFPLCRCEIREKSSPKECTCSPDLNSNNGIAEHIYMGEHMKYGTNGIFYLSTNSSKPFGQGPQMNVILPDIIVSDGNDLTSRLVRASAVDKSPSSEATVKYKNQILKVKMKNTFTTKYFPNEDIIKLCRAVLIKMSNFTSLPP